MCGRDAVVNRVTFLPPPPFPQPSIFFFFLIGFHSRLWCKELGWGVGCGYRGIPAVRMGWGCWGLFGTDAEVGKALPGPHPCPQTEIMPLSSNQSLVESTIEQTFFRRKNEWRGPASSGFLPVGFLADFATLPGWRAWAVDEAAGAPVPCAAKPKHLQSHPAAQNQELWTQDTKPAYFNFFKLSLEF